MARSSDKALSEGEVLPAAGEEKLDFDDPTLRGEKIIFCGEQLYYFEMQGRSLQLKRQLVQMDNRKPDEIQARWDSIPGLCSALTN